MSHIYIITNKISGKQYVGYTSYQNVEERFNKHWISAKHNGWQDNSPFHLAMLKYGGKQYFEIQSLYEFNEEEEDWKELEQKYIKLYNTLIPNGYNLLPGGNKPKTHYGNDNFKTKYPDELLPELYEMLKNPKIRYEIIAEKTGLTVDYLYRINQGKFRYNQELDYPLRKYDSFELRALGVIEALSDGKLSNKQIAEKFGIRPNEVSSINHGKKYKYLWHQEFPIRKKRILDNYQEKQDLAKKVLIYKKENPKITHLQIQKEFNISRSILDKILKNQFPYDLQEDI